MNTIRLLLFWLAAVPVAFAQEAPVLVGAAISQSGAHAELAADYAKGIGLWRDEVNAAGGLLGRRVALRMVDDGSEAIRNRALYARLIDEDKADLLIGPYGSAATLIAAAEAERARRVMVNGAGAAAAVHGRSPRYVFQSAIPYGAYGEGVLQVAAEHGMRKLYIVARDDAASREMAEATQRGAGTAFASAEIEAYRPGSADFRLIVEKARALGIDAWIAFGDGRDAAEMVKTFRRLDYAPALFFARGASQPRFIEIVGQDAEFSLGLVDFDERIGRAARAFARAYRKKWDAPPTLAAAEGYAAGTVLGAAVRAAGSLDQEKLRAALAALEMPTVLGAYKAGPNGAQVGAKPIVVQIRNGQLDATPPFLLPYPQWNERAPIR